MFIRVDLVYEVEGRVDKEEDAHRRDASIGEEQHAYRAGEAGQGEAQGGQYGACCYCGPGAETEGQPHSHRGCQALDTGW